LKYRRLAFITKPFSVLLISSIALHLIVISQINWQLKAPKLKDEVFEVELIKPVIKKPTVKKRKPKPAKKKKVKKPSQKPVIVKRTITTKSPEAIKPLSTKPKTNRTPISPAPKPTLSISSELDEKSKWKRKSEPIKLGSRKLAITPKDNRGRPKSLLAPLPEVKKSETVNAQPKQSINDSSNIKDLDVGEITQSNVKKDIKTGAGQLKESASYKIVESGSGSEKGKPVIAESSKKNSEFEGEIRQRKVIYKPEPPQLDIDSDVTISLKFTVLPNGQVDQIFSLRKADPTLERIAIGLLQQYRFEPLFESDSVQNGIIHFTIERNKRE